MAVNLWEVAAGVYDLFKKSFGDQTPDPYSAESFESSPNTERLFVDIDESIFVEMDETIFVAWILDRGYE
jgi:hypothetical protein